MWPRSSAISGRSPSSRSTARKSSAPGPRPPASARRGRVPRRDRPVRDEAAEVVDAREVDELEDAPEALDPPVVAGRAVHRPVVERVAPALAVRAQRVGRRAGDLAAREELRPALDVGAACRRRRSARRRSAGRRARPRRRATPPTPARSAPGRRAPPRRRSAPSSPVQKGWRATKSSISPAETRASGRRGAAGDAANADGDRYGEPNSSGGPSGRTCHHDWPAASSQSTKRYASRSSFPDGSDVGCRRIPAERGELHVLILPDQ